MEANDTYNAFDDAPVYSDPVKPHSLSTGTPYEESAYETAVDTGANYSASAAKDNATDDTRKPGMRGTIDFYKSKVSFLPSFFFCFTKDPQRHQAKILTSSFLHVIISFLFKKRNQPNPQRKTLLTFFSFGSFSLPILSSPLQNLVIVTHPLTFFIFAHL